MSATNGLILTPITVAATSYVIRVTSAAVTEDLTFVAALLTVGRYYWMSGDTQADASTDGGRGDLVTLLQTCLNTNSGGLTYAVSLSVANEAITVSADGNFQLLWSHANTTLDEAIFGFTNASWPAAPGTTTTGTLLPQGIYRPAAPFSVDSRDMEPIVGGYASSISGRMRHSNVSGGLAERTIGFIYLLSSDILDEDAAATRPTGPFESHWNNRIKAGFPFRVYDDETGTGTFSNARLYKARVNGFPFARMGDTPQLIRRWTLDLDIVRAED